MTHDNDNLTPNQIEDARVNKILKDDGERFSVCQFFPDGSYEYVARHVPVESALSAAAHYTMNVSAHAGLTERVIITDSGDCICFEWIFGKGVVFPDDVVPPQKRDYSK